METLIKIVHYSLYVFLPLCGFGLWYAMAICIKSNYDVQTFAEWHIYIIASFGLVLPIIGGCLAYGFEQLKKYNFMNSEIMEVYIITREDGHYYGSYEVYKVVDSEEKAKQIIKDNPDHRYDNYVVE